MNRVTEAVEFKVTIWGKFDKNNEQMCYEVAWYCNENKSIHSNLKSTLNCKCCKPTQDKIEYEALKRLEFLVNGYFIHCLGSQFSKLSTERICELYNVKMNYFRPWV